MIDKKIFILLYDDRSGSTYLASLLAKHPDIGITIESLWLTNLIKHGELIASPTELDNIIKLLYEEKKFLSWMVDKEALKNYWNNESYPIKTSKLINYILGIYFNANYPDSSVWIIKQGSIHHINGFKKLFPDVKFIHIIRDGRAVYNSKKKAINSVSLEIMQRDPIKSALIWKKHMSMPPKKINNSKELLEVRYEDLISDHFDVLKIIFKYLDIPPIDPLDTSGETTHKSDYLSSIPKSQLHLHKNVGSKPLIDRISAWKKDLPPSEIFLYELFAKRELVAKGYTPISLNLSIREPTVLLKIFVLLLKSYWLRAIQKTINLTKKFLYYIKHPAECLKKIKWRFSEKFNYI